MFRIKFQKVQMMVRYTKECSVSGLRPSSLFKREDSFFEAESVPFPLVEAELSPTDGTLVSHGSNDYDSVYRNQLSRYSLSLLVGTVLYPFPETLYFSVFFGKQPKNRAHKHPK